MLKTIFMVTLLAVVSNSAMAEWVELTSTDKETYYVNPATIRKKGSIVEMWSVMDVKQSKLTKLLQGINKILSVGDAKTPMSTVTQKGFDCKEGQIRVLKYSTYSDNLGGGDPIVINSEIGKWEAVVPGSIDESLLEYACDPCFSTGKYSGACRGMQ